MVAEVVSKSGRADGPDVSFLSQGKAGIRRLILCCALSITAPMGCLFCCAFFRWFRFGKKQSQHRGYGCSQFRLLRSQAFFLPDFLQELIPITDLKRQGNVDLMSLVGRHHFDVTVDWVDTLCDSVKLNCRLLLHYKGAAALFVRKGDALLVKAYHPEKDPVEWGNEYQTSLEINKMNNDSVVDFKIIKAGDYLMLDCSSVISALDWHRFLQATSQDENGSHGVQFMYFGEGPSREDDSFISLVKLRVNDSRHFPVIDTIGPPRSSPGHTPGTSS
jgi:hypothetical protein